MATRILHQKDVLEVVARELGDNTPIADPVEPGATYSQTEAASTQDAVVAILGVLRGAGLIPAS